MVTPFKNSSKRPLQRNASYTGPRHGLGLKTLIELVLFRLGCSVHYLKLHVVNKLIPHTRTNKNNRHSLKALNPKP